MKKVELLAPAGNLAALKAAVENGADAVYIGGDQFSARQKAENFTREQMAAGIAYAHQRGCAVHVAVNTLVRNEEIGDLITYGYELAELGGRRSDCAGFRRCPYFAANLAPITAACQYPDGHS